MPKSVVKKELGQALRIAILIATTPQFELRLNMFFPNKTKEFDIEELPKISSPPSCRRLPLTSKD